MPEMTETYCQRDQLGPYFANEYDRLMKPGDETELPRVLQKNSSFLAHRLTLLLQPAFRCDCVVQDARVAALKRFCSGVNANSGVREEVCKPGIQDMSWARCKSAQYRRLQRKLKYRVPLIILVIVHVSAYGFHGDDAARIVDCVLGFTALILLLSAIPLPRRLQAGAWQSLGKP